MYSGIKYICNYVAINTIHHLILSVSPTLLATFILLSVCEFASFRDVM